MVVANIDCLLRIMCMCISFDLLNTQQSYYHHLFLDIGKPRHRV